MARVGDPERVRTLLVARVTTDPEARRWTRRAIRVAIRVYHDLPDDNDLKLDLGRVYPWLSKEMKDVFDLYAAGVGLVGISDYWSLYLGSERDVDRRWGEKLIRRLITDIERNFDRHLREVDLAELAGGPKPPRAEAS